MSTTQPRRGVLAALAATWFALFICVFVAGRLATGAPGPKFDTIVGPISYWDGDARSPVVILPDDDPAKPGIDYWLVFARPDVEVQAQKLQLGDRVKVTGRLAAGGKWRYIIVESITKDGE